jgi:SAM-dependent methyltransferase
VKLNLGCGTKPLDGFVNVDLAPGDGVDVVLDVDQPVIGWPLEWWADGNGRALVGAVDEVHAYHLFEHLERPLDFMEACWRVLKPEGLLHIEVPHWQSRNAYTDPTHRRFCTEETFHYWVRGNWISDHVNPAGYNRNLWWRYDGDPARVGEDLVVDLRKVSPLA